MQNRKFDVLNKCCSLEKFRVGQRFSDSKKKGCPLRLYTDLRLFSRQYYTYYNTTLLRNMFIRWKNVWWSSKVVWKLGHKAACHYKYTIMSMAYTRWKKYCLHRIESLKNKIKALRFYTRRLMKSFFKKLQLRISVLHDLSKICYLNREIYMILLIKQKYLLFIQNEFEGYYNIAMAAIGYRFWCDRLLQKALNAWRVYLKLKAKKLQINANAYMYRNAKLKMVFYHHWKLYSYNRGIKFKIYEVSKDFFCYKIISKYVHQWSRKYKDNMVCYSLLNEAHILYEKSIMRQYFNHLKLNHYHMNTIKQKSSLADNYYCSSLKKKGLLYLKSYCNYKKLCQTLFNKARKMGENTALKVSWQNWLAFVEEQQMLKPYHLYEKSNLHYRKVLLSKCFTRMVIYHKIKRKKSDLSLRGKSLSFQVLLKYYLQEWKNKRQEHHLSGTLDDKGMDIYNFNTLIKVLKLWRNRWYETRKILELENAAVLHIEENILKKSFVGWLHTLNEKKLILAFQAEAAHFYVINLKLFIINHWRKYLAWKKKKQYYSMKSSIIYERSLKTKIMKRWIILKSASNSQQQKANLFIKNLQKNQIKTLFFQWKYIKNESKHWHSIINKFHLCQEVVIKSCFFVKWSKFVALKKKNRLITSNYLPYVHELCIKSLKKDCLISWSNLLKDLKQELQMKEKACKFHERLITVSYFTFWVKYHSIQLNKNLLNDKGKNLQAYFIQRLVLYWKSLHHEKALETAKTSLAFDKWNRRKLEKAFKTWRLHFNYTLQKRNEFLEAANNHKFMLQEAVISQWIQASIILRIKQEQYFCDTYSKKNARKFQLGVKYGEMWRQKVWKRKGTCPAHAFSENKGILIAFHKKLQPSEDILGSPHQLSLFRRAVSSGCSIDIQQRTEPRIPHFLFESIKQSVFRN